MTKNSGIMKENDIETINIHTDIREMRIVSCRASDEGHAEAASRLRRSGRSKRSIKTMLSTLLLASALIMGGCSAGKESGTGTAPAEAAAKAEHDPEQIFPMVFENYGREVTIEKRPERVLTLGPNCT